VRKPKVKAAGARKRADGRRQLLIYLRHEVIVSLKRAALDRERPAYELAEEAIQEWLARDKRTIEAVLEVLARDKRTK
jgi:hypothetical protein